MLLRAFIMFLCLLLLPVFAWAEEWSLGNPGPNAVRFEELHALAKQQVEAGDIDAALNTYHEAHDVGHRAVLGAEFGVDVAGIRVGNIKYDLPLRANLVDEIATEAMEAAADAGRAEGAIRWASRVRGDYGRRKRVEGLLERARAAGQYDASDRYGVWLLRDTIRQTRPQIDRARRARERGESYLILHVMIVLGGFIAWVVWRRRRPSSPFVLAVEPTNSRQILAEPRPIDRGYAFVMGIGFALAVFSVWLFWMGTDDMHRTKSVAFFVGGWVTCAAGVLVGAWAAYGRIEAASAEFDISSSSYELSVAEVVAWLRANRAAVMRDAAAVDMLGRTRDDLAIRVGLGRIEEPGRRAIVAGFVAGDLARRGRPVPPALRETIEDLPNQPLHVLESCIATWVAYAEMPLDKWWLGAKDNEQIALYPRVEVPANDDAVLSASSDWLAYAMVRGRRWAVEGWSLRFMGHGWETVEFASIVWATFDARDELICSFRLDGEGGLVDEHGDALSLDELEGVVGVAHAAELGTAAVARWCEQLADFGLVSLIDQLDRPTELPGTGTMYDLSVEWTREAYDRYEPYHEWNGTEPMLKLRCAHMPEVDRRRGQLVLWAWFGGERWDGPLECYRLGFKASHDMQSRELAEVPPVLLSEALWFVRSGGRRWALDHDFTPDWP